MAEEIKVLCPWCNKGEVYIEGAGNANVSIKCPRCQHCFKLRLNDFNGAHTAAPQAAGSGSQDLSCERINTSILYAHY